MTRRGCGGKSKRIILARRVMIALILFFLIPSQLATNDYHLGKLDGAFAVNRIQHFPIIEIVRTPMVVSASDPARLNRTSIRLMYSIHNADSNLSLNQTESKECLGWT